MGSIKERLLSKIKVDNNGCWIWQGYCQPNGYGRIRMPDSAKLAHRVSYEIFIGEISAGLVIDHTCRIRQCVNPDHIRAVTQKENVRAANERIGHWQKDKSFCPRGHQLRFPNLVESYRIKGHRKCLACARANSSANQAFRLYGKTIDRQCESDRRYAEIMKEN